MRKVVLVLIVDDEPVARMLHLSILVRIPGVSVVGASTVAEARALIAVASPEVVVLDMQLPDGSGLDVLAALEEKQVSAFLIVITAYLEEWQSRLPQSARICILSKPAPMRELRNLVEQTLRKETVPGPFSVLDYVQLACMGQHSVVIECIGREGRGEILVEKGQLYSARDELGDGVEAFNRLVVGSSAHVRAMSESRARGLRNLDQRWELLALEAIHQADEAARPAAPKSPPAPAAPPPSAEQVEADFNGYVDKALRAVVARDFGTARIELEKALAIRPNDPLILHRLERLRMMRTRD